MNPENPIFDFIFGETKAGKKVHEAVIDYNYFSAEEVEDVKRFLISNRGQSVMKLLAIMNYTAKDRKDETAKDAYARFPVDFVQFISSCSEYANRKKQEDNRKEELKAKQKA